jgi:hypothetical protein
VSPGAMRTVGDYEMRIITISTWRFSSYLYTKLVDPFLREHKQEEEQCACVKENNVVHKITLNSEMQLPVQRAQYPCCLCEKLFKC